MNGVHDMGGQHGLGAIVPEPEGPPFHAAWEARAHAIIIAAPTRGNIDAGRHQRERIPGATYLAMTYYERWFEGLRQMLLAGGLVSPEELTTAIADPAAPKASPRLASAGVATASAPATSTPPAIPACRATHAGGSALLHIITAPTSFPIAMPMAAVRTRSPYTPSGSARVNFGGRTLRLGTQSVSTCGSPILSNSHPLALSGLPKDVKGPIFAEPWEAQAFALAVRLNAVGALSWTEWAAALSRQLARHPDDDGSHYYAHWVAALESLTTERGLVSAPDLASRKDAWADGYRHTPHGKPVELSEK